MRSVASTESPGSIGFPMKAVAGRLQNAVSACVESCCLYRVIADHLEGLQRLCDRIILFFSGW